MLDLVPLETLLAFTSAGILLNLTPGADVMFATASGMAGGPRAGIAAGAGVGLGGFWHVGLAAIGVAAEYAHFIPEWAMLVLFLLAFFLYGYCIKRAWKVARFIKRVKRRMRRNSGKNTTLTK